MHSGRVRARSPLAIALLGAATIAPSCSSEPSVLESKEPPAPNVLRVSVDTLRADHLGCHGYDRATSPNLDRLRLFGVVFEDVSASSPWTLPSHASMLTGLYPYGAWMLTRPSRT